jgi:hypothetical protein
MTKQFDDAVATLTKTYAADIAEKDAEIANLKKQLPVPAPPPARVLLGTNASSQHQHDEKAAAFAPVDVWRVYRQPGESSHLLNEFTRKPGELLAISHKIMWGEAKTGQHDADMTALAKSLVDGDEVIPTHEAEDDIEKGHYTLDDYHNICAWTRRIVKAANPKVKVGACTMGAFTVSGQKGRVWKDYIFEGAEFVGFDQYWSGILEDHSAFGGNLSVIPQQLALLAGAAASVKLPWRLYEMGIGTREAPVGSSTRNNAIADAAKEAKRLGCGRIAWFTADFNSWPADPTAIAALRAGLSA